MEGKVSGSVHEVVAAADGDDCGGVPGVVFREGEDGAEEVRGEGAACVESDEEDGDGCGAGAKPGVDGVDECGGREVDCAVGDAGEGRAGSGAGAVCLAVAAVESEGGCSEKTVECAREISLARADIDNVDAVWQCEAADELAHPRDFVVFLGRHPKPVLFHRPRELHGLPPDLRPARCSDQRY